MLINQFKNSSKVCCNQEVVLPAIMLLRSELESRINKLINKFFTLTVVQGFQFYLDTKFVPFLHQHLQLSTASPQYLPLVSGLSKMITNCQMHSPKLIALFSLYNTLSYVISNAQVTIIELGIAKQCHLQEET